MRLNSPLVVSACVVALLVAAGLATATAQPAARAAAPTRAAAPGATEAGYAIGMDLASTTLAAMAGDGVEVDREALIRGFTDAVRDAEPEMTGGAMRRVLADIEIAVGTRETVERMRQDPLFRIQVEDNASRGNAFQRRFAERDTVERLPSGVLYEVVDRGAGDPVAGADAMVVTYTGATAAGVRFADERGLRVELAALLPVIRDAVERMRVGDRWILVVPPESAFGLAGRDGGVGPNETLVISAMIEGVEK
jgi:FKBP-type peptidyl-prolyl cis-trans isomerase FklB